MIVFKNNYIIYLPILKKPVMTWLTLSTAATAFLIILQQDRMAFGWIEHITALCGKKKERDFYGTLYFYTQIEKSRQVKYLPMYSIAML